jgi:hypothetical protein
MKRQRLRLLLQLMSPRLLLQPMMLPLQKQLLLLLLMQLQRKHLLLRRLML